MGMLTYARQMAKHPCNSRCCGYLMTLTLLHVRPQSVSVETVEWRQQRQAQLPLLRVEQFGSFSREGVWLLGVHSTATYLAFFQYTLHSSHRVERQPDKVNGCAEMTSATCTQSLRVHVSICDWLVQAISLLVTRAPILRVCLLLHSRISVDISLCGASAHSGMECTVAVQEG